MTTVDSRRYWLIYVREGAEEDKAERTRAFAHVHPQCRTSQVGATPHGTYRELW